MRLTHEQTKTQIKQYREIAIKLYESPTCSINTYGAINFVEKGAWVEAMIFIPKEELND